MVAPIDLTIRTLRGVEDLVRAYALYEEHAGAYLPLPDIDTLHEAMREHQLFACWHGDGRLVAIGGTFWVGRACHAAGPPIGVYELAGLVVNPDVRGLRPHGIQDWLVAIRVAALALQQATNTCLISSVAAANSASRKSMERCGLVSLGETDVPRWLKDVRRTWMAGQKPAVIDYIVPPHALNTLRTIIQTALTAELRPPKDDATRYKLRLARDHVLDDIAGSAWLLPSWNSVVPPSRLLGSEPPFTLWPR